MTDIAYEPEYDQLSWHIQNNELHIHKWNWRIHIKWATKITFVTFEFLFASNEKKIFICFTITFFGFLWAYCTLHSACIQKGLLDDSPHFMKLIMKRFVVCDPITKTIFFLSVSTWMCATCIIYIDFSHCTMFTIPFSVFHRFSITISFPFL